MANNCIDHL